MAFTPVEINEGMTGLRVRTILNSLFTAISGDISGLETEMSTLGSDLEALGGDLETLATRVAVIKGLTSDPDSLSALTDYGIWYNYRYWRGLLAVVFDHQNVVSQVALSSSTPSYSGNTVSWVSGPCVMVRTYSNDSWSHWDIASGGTSDKVVDPDTGMTVKQELALLAQKIDGISYESRFGYRISSTGAVQTASTQTNHLLVADVSGLIGRTVIATGRLFAKTSGGTTYCWWAIHDASNNVLSKSEVSSSSSSESRIDVPITIPANAKYLYVIGNEAQTPNIKYLPLDQLRSEFANTKDEVDSLSFANIKSFVYSQKKIDGNGLVLDASTTTNRTLFADVSAYVGKTLYLDGVLFASTSSKTYCWYAFHDVNGNVLGKSETSSTNVWYSNVSIVVPSGAKMLYVQGTTNSTIPASKARINDVVEDLLNTSSSGQAKSTRKFPLDYLQLLSSSGRIAISNNYNNKANLHTIDYIRVKNTVKILNLGGTQQSIRVFFYDSNLDFISNTLYADTTNGLQYIEVDDIPTNAVWFRVSIILNNSDIGNKREYGKNYVEIESEWDNTDETCKEPYAEYVPFLYSVCCNIPEKIANNPSIKTKQVFATDEGLLHLPPTYSPEGMPTPVIFYIHGDAERYEAGESTFSGHVKMQQCWSDAGFAQVDLDLIPSCYNQPTMASTGGTRDDLECLSAAWEWITNHFNIDKRGFYLIGRSRGGQCVLEVLGKGGATKLPIIAAISMAGANSIFEYSVYSVANENEWQLWCNAHGLPTSGRPTWGRTDTTRSFLSKTECYNFVVANWDLWWRRALTGWGLITKNTDGISPRNYFDNFIYPYVQNNNSYTNAIEEFFEQMVDTMEAKSPIPLRLDWCVGDQTQSYLPFGSTKNWSSVFSEILLNTPGSLTEYRQWEGVDASNPYGETNPHYAENMIFYNGSLTLPNGVVTSNPSKLAVEWMLFCMGHDTRFHITNYSLPNDW